MIRAIRHRYYLGVGQGTARRSWVWAADVARIVPKMAEVGCVYNPSDGCDPSFAEIENGLGHLVGQGPVRRLPLPWSRMLASLGEIVQVFGIRRFPFDRRRLEKMTFSLTFSDEKARKVLGWRPISVINHLPEVFGPTT